MIKTTASITVKNISRLSFPNHIGNGPINPTTEYFVSAFCGVKNIVPKNIMKNPKNIVEDMSDYTANMPSIIT